MSEDESLYKQVLSPCCSIARSYGIYPLLGHDRPRITSSHESLTDQTTVLFLLDLVCGLFFFLNFKIALSLCSLACTFISSIVWNFVLYPTLREPIVNEISVVENTVKHCKKTFGGLCFVSPHLQEIVTLI